MTSFSWQMSAERGNNGQICWKEWLYNGHVILWPNQHNFRISTINNEARPTGMCWDSLRESRTMVTQAIQTLPQASLNHSFRIAKMQKETWYNYKYIRFLLSGRWEKNYRKIFCVFRKINLQVRVQSLILCDLISLSCIGLFPWVEVSL